MPRWHRLMLNYMNQERLERIRADGPNRKFKAPKRYFKNGNRLPFTPRSYSQSTP